MDENKTNYQNTLEENLFREYQSLIDKKSMLIDQQEILALEKTLASKKSKLEHFINIKITSEEEKYVYLVSKLKEHKNYVIFSIIKYTYHKIL